MIAQQLQVMDTNNINFKYIIRTIIVAIYFSAHSLVPNCVVVYT